MKKSLLGAGIRLGKTENQILYPHTILRLVERWGFLEFGLFFSFCPCSVIFVSKGGTRKRTELKHVKMVFYINFLRFLEEEDSIAWAQPWGWHRAWCGSVALCTVEITARLWVVTDVSTAPLWLRPAGSMMRSPRFQTHDVSSVGKGDISQMNTLLPFKSV